MKFEIGDKVIACIKLKRKWIGIEGEEDYIPIIKARIKPFMENTTKFSGDNRDVQ